jgi:prepilin-type N-terminal cleavage/methylation domain-containing protein
VGRVRYYLKGTRGLTLIEVLVAVAIIAAAFVPLLTMFTTGAHAGQYARYVTIGNQLAASRLEELRAAGYDALSSQPRQSFATLPQYAGFGEFECQVSVTEVEIDLKEVTVAVFWTRPRNTASVSATTLVRRP